MKYWHKSQGQSQKEPKTKRAKLKVHLTAGPISVYNTTSAEKSSTYQSIDKDSDLRHLQANVRGTDHCGLLVPVGTCPSNTYTGNVQAW